MAQHFAAVCIDSQQFSIVITNKALLAPTKKTSEILLNTLAAQSHRRRAAVNGIRTSLTNYKRIWEEHRRFSGAATLFFDSRFVAATFSLGKRLFNAVW